MNGQLYEQSLVRLHEVLGRTQQSARRESIPVAALADRLEEAERVVGPEETTAFSARMTAILNAIRGGQFGHWWSILSVGPPH